VSGWVAVSSHTEADGSKVGAADTIYARVSGAATGTAPPFNVGLVTMPIVWQWRVTGGHDVHDFPEVRQEHEIFADGRCESRKGGHTESKMYNDPASSY
jgi:hypothetical protein